MNEDHTTSRRELAAFAVLAALIRLVVVLRTSMPGRDGATYQWMAERVAGGDVGAAFRAVFHPLYPLLAGAAMHTIPAAAPMLIGQLVSALPAALAVVPLQALTSRRFGAVAARGAALTFAFGLWFVRYPAECLSEGLFHPLVAVWAWALLANRPRPALAGATAGLAYAARPEGLALLALGALRLDGAARWRMLLAGVLAAAWVPFGYLHFGDGFTLTPKASFNYEVGIGGDASPVRHYLDHALQVPFTAFEAIGYLAYPLAVVGLCLHWPRRGEWRASPALLLVAPLLVQWIVIPLLRSHLRFQSGFGVLLLPLTGAALARLAATRGTRVWLAAVVVTLLPDLLRLPQARGDDRLIERHLGEWMRPRLGTGGRVVTDMPRLEYFAGQEPGPPRRIVRDELLRAAAEPQTRFVTVVGRNPEATTANDKAPVYTAADFAALGLHAVELPPALAAEAAARRVLVFGH